MKYVQPFFGCPPIKLSVHFLSSARPLVLSFCFPPPYDFLLSSPPLPSSVFLLSPLLLPPLLFAPLISSCLLYVLLPCSSHLLSFAPHLSSPLFPCSSPLLPLHISSPLSPLFFSSSNFPASLFCRSCPHLFSNCLLISFCWKTIFLSNEPIVLMHRPPPRLTPPPPPPPPHILSHLTLHPPPSSLLVPRGRGF
ncbi:unnamed protein product [Arctogadus glacialis]